MHYGNPKIQEAKSKLLDQLVPYLKYHGIEFHGNMFKCINPAHEDSSPSTSIVPESQGTVWHCFGCGMSGDIFHAAHILENKPITGPAWIETLKYLCEKCQIPVPDVELSKEDKELIEIYRAYEDAAYIIQTSTVDKVVPVFNDRGWSDSIGYKYSIGFVDSYTSFINQLKAQGHTDEILQKAGLSRKTNPDNPSYIQPSMFEADNLIFTIHDHIGTPVAFAARNGRYDSNQNVSKYINSALSPIYRKREILYGLYLSKASAVKKGLIIVEGYPDWITLQEKGIYNSVALCGTALTKEHISLIMNLGITKIQLCLDNDNGGREALTRILDEVIAEIPTLQVEVIQLPEGQDPDDVLKDLDQAQAFKLWNELPIISAFMWRLKKFGPDTSMEDVATKMIPFIITEPNIILREKMAKDLATHTGIRIQAIQNQMDKLTRMEEFKESERLKSIVNSVVKDLQRNPRSARDILNIYSNMLEEQEKTISTDTLGVVETSKSFESMVDKWRNRKDSIVGIRTGLTELDQAINGLQEGKAAAIGGKPNHGKTALVSTIAYNVCTMNEDCMVIVHNTDDNVETFCSRLIAIDQMIPMNWVTNPKFHMKLKGQAGYDPALQQKWKDGVKNIQDIIDSGKLVVKDSTHGTTLNYTEALIKYYKNNNPNKRILVIFDNFHKATDYMEMEERIRYKRMSGRIKLLAERYNVAFLATMEYTKMEEGTRPHNSNLAESGQMEYDLSVIMHVYNALSDLGAERAKAVIIPVEGAEPIPIVELKIGKNKQGSFKESLFYSFYTDKGKYEEYPRLKALEAFYQKKTSQYGNLSQGNRT